MVPAFIVAGYGIATSTDALRDLALTKLNHLTSSSAEKIVNSLGHISDDVLFLSKVPPIRGIIRAREGKGKDMETGSSYDDWIERLEQIFVSMMQARSEYMQLRYLDENGNEMVRVDSQGTTIEVIEGEQLQNKGDRDYFNETMQLNVGEIYVSRLSLNQELGKIEIPYKPTIRYATPIFSKNGERKGIVIANVRTNYLFERLKQLNREQEIAAFMVDEQGYYLYHPDENKAWSFDLKTNENIRKDYLLPIATQLLSGGEGNIFNGTKDVMTYQTIYPSFLNRKRFLVVVYQSPKNLIFATVNSFKKNAYILVFFGVISIVIVGWLQAKKLVQLIRGLIYKVSNLSQDILVTMEEQEAISKQQSHAVDRTTDNLSTLGESSQEIAREAEAVASCAQQALTLAEEGSKIVENTLDRMLIFRETMESIAQQNKRMGEQTSQIGSISMLAKLVGDLATQTNMLALNAAVEASRAGKEGEGFAVVAKEIRQLADRSREAAEKINGIIPEIQGSINSSLAVTEKGRQTVESGVKNARESAESFQGVTEVVSELFIRNKQIYQNTERQAIALNQVINSMHSLSRDVAESAKGISLVKMGTHNLNEAADSLKKVV
jgi:methyl-accepting chemotaxis protein